MFHLPYGNKQIKGITTDMVTNAFAITGNRAGAAALLKIKYGTLCSWIKNKYSYQQAMQKGLEEHAKK